MSILINPDKYINLSLYYIEQPSKHGFTKIKFLSSEAELAAYKDDKRYEVKEIKTQWKPMAWKDFININSKALSLNTSEDGQVRTSLNIFAYRDAILKACLLRWNLESPEMTEPTADQIERLDPNAASELVKAYETATEFSDES